MIIHPDLTALGSLDRLQTRETLSKSLARLSSSSAAVLSSDDSSGAVSSTTLGRQLSEVENSQARVGHALSFTQTQDGYLKRVADALRGMGDLAEAAQDPSLSDADRDQLQTQYSQLAEYVVAVASREFNGISLFSTESLEAGPGADGIALTQPGIDLRGGAYAAAVEANVDSDIGADDALAQVNLALAQLTRDRGGIEAFQDRLKTAAEQLTVSKDNFTAATRRIQDMNAAETSAGQARNSILAQSATAMLAQANATPQAALRVLP